MTDDNRGLLRTIKVPFDVKAIFLGGLGYLVFIAGGWILDWGYKGVQDGTHVVSRFIVQGLDWCSISLAKIPIIGGEIAGICSTLYGTPCPKELNWYEMAIAGVWFLLCLSVFGGGIARVIALRIARDESMGVADALKFSVTKLRFYVQLPLLLGAMIFFFWLCNLLAGIASSIPYFGPVLFIVLYPLVILSSLIILLIAVGGLLGLFLMVAAVSAENNGSLDAISRAFSYLYSRPLQFFFYYFLVFLLASIIVLVGVNIFLGQPGVSNWGIIASSFFEGTADGTQIEIGFAAGANAALAKDFVDFSGLGFFEGVGAFFSWLYMILLVIGVHGFVVSYIMGGTTSIYFALRRDVDGTEDSEIYVEGAEEEEDFGLPPVPPPAEEEEAAAEEDEAPAEEEEAPAEEEEAPAEEEETPAEEEAPAEEEEPETPEEEEPEEEKKE